MRGKPRTPARRDAEGIQFPVHFEQRRRQLVADAFERQPPVDQRDHLGSVLRAPGVQLAAFLKHNIRNADLQRTPLKKIRDKPDWIVSYWTGISWASCLRSAVRVYTPLSLSYCGQPYRHSIRDTKNGGSRICTSNSRAGQKSSASFCLSDWRALRYYNLWRLFRLALNLKISAAHRLAGGFFAPRMGQKNPPRCGGGGRSVTDRFSVKRPGSCKVRLFLTRPMRMLV